MKISYEFAESFAVGWLKAWNTGNIEAILEHYSDDIAFSSPFVLKSGPSTGGTVKGKSALRKYFEGALEKNPGLQFELKHIMVGIKSITLIYVRNGSMLAAETMIFNDEGKVTEGLSHYPAESIYGIL
jgi:hypothetical protein